jgi:hypothetical protein
VNESLNALGGKRDATPTEEESAFVHTNVPTMQDFNPTVKRFGMVKKPLWSS